MEEVSSDQPKFLESIFLNKFLMFRFRCVVKAIQIYSPQTKKCINAYRKNSKKTKESQIINKTMNNKMNKTGKIKSL